MAADRPLTIEMPTLAAEALDPDRQARYRVLHGGRGSAKSWSVARALIGRAVSRRTRWLCCREYQTSIRESVHRLLTTQIEDLGLAHLFVVQRDAILGPHGSEFAFKGLSDGSLDSLKSYEAFDGAWIEEGQSVSRRSLQILKPTIRRPGSEIWITLNPENEEDPVYADYILDPPKNAIVQRINWHDNLWFPDVLRDEMTADYARDPETAAWIWGGDIRRNSDKQVLRGKCETRPFVPDPALWDGPYQGVDWGYGQDPSCLIRVWLWEDCLWVEHEAYGDRVELDDLAALFDSIPDARAFPTRADCSRPETISHVRRAGYARLSACRKWPGCVEDRVAYLRKFHRIYIHPRCSRIEREGKLWSWKVDKAGQVLNVLVDGNDHGWDAVGYALEPHIVGARRKGLPPPPASPGEFNGLPGTGRPQGHAHGWLG